MATILFFCKDYNIDLKNYLNSSVREADLKENLEINNYKFKYIKSGSQKHTIIFLLVENQPNFSEIITNKNKEINFENIVDLINNFQEMKPPMILCNHWDCKIIKDSINVQLGSEYQLEVSDSNENIDYMKLVYLLNKGIEKDIRLKNFRFAFYGSNNTINLKSQDSIEKVISQWNTINSIIEISDIEIQYLKSAAKQLNEINSQL